MERTRSKITFWALLAPVTNVEVVETETSF